MTNTDPQDNTPPKSMRAEPVDSESLDTDSVTDPSQFEASIDQVMAELGNDGPTEGLTPIHRQNFDESRVDEVLVEDNLDDTGYPTIRDIADDDAVQHSHDDDL